MLSCFVFPLSMDSCFLSGFVATPFTTTFFVLALLTNAPQFEILTIMATYAAYIFSVSQFPPIFLWHIPAKFCLHLLCLHYSAV